MFGNSNQVLNSVGNIRQTWNAVRSSVLDADRKAAASVFDDLVNQIEKPQTAGAYSKLAVRVLDEVDVLEQVFVKHEASDDDEESD